MQDIVKELIEHNITIATMESCTGGAVASAITNVEGASAILQFSAVTYSNEFKIKMGVSYKTLDKHSVYSLETARDMAKSVSLFSHSRLGVGITGRFNREDVNNPGGETDMVYIAIYDSYEEAYYEMISKSMPCPRIENKEIIIQHVKNMLYDFLSDYLSSDQY